MVAKDPDSRFDK